MDDSTRQVEPLEAIEDNIDNRSLAIEDNRFTLLHSLSGVIDAIGS